MASYDGHLVELPHRAEDTLRCSDTIASGLEVRNIVFPPEDIESVVPIAQGDYTYVQQDENETAYDGTKVDSFLDDYYYRIHISPAAIAFGPIASPAEETFIVWNAWFETKNCTAVTEDDPTEYTLDPEADPFTLVSLAWETFTVSVTETGSVEFDCTIIFTFPGEEPYISLTGTRVAVFPFAPSIPMMETLEWKTDIMTSKDGSEQRMILRPIPRQGFRFDVMLKNEQEQAILDALMFLWAKRNWGVPVWGEWVEHTDNISAGDTTINLDTTNADFRDDSYAIIWQTYDSYEAIKIETVAAGSLTLEKAVLNNWSGVKVIMPLRIAYMLSPSNWNVNADGVGNFSCSFTVTDNYLLETYVAPETYNSLPVLEASLEAGGLDNQVDSDAKFTDYELSKYTMFSDSDFNIYVQQHVFRKITKADIWAFREFLHSLYGRRGTCWIATDKEDFRQTQVLGAAETEMRVANVGWARNMALNDLRTHIAFIFPDGARYYRQITGLTQSGDEDIVGIDSALGIEVQPGDCVICILDKCRLTEDKVEIEWQEPFRIQSRINFTRVKA